MFTTKDGAHNTIGAIPLPVAQGRVWLWHKAKEAFKYVYENHLEDADWFFKADDDTFAILENMRYYLKDYSYNQSIAFGYKLRIESRNQTYFGGGSGYVMSKAALTNFVQKGVYSRECYPQRDGSEDVNVGKSV